MRPVGVLAVSVMAFVEGCAPSREHGRSHARLPCIMATGLALFALGCGPSVAGPSRGPTASTSPSATASPALSVSPSAGLVGGQQLQVRLSEFPLDATVSVYECAGSPSAGGASSCGENSGITLYTGTTGTASGAFTAQASAFSGSNQTTTACQDQCLLVAVVIKLGPKGPPSPPPMASAPLSFSTTAAPSLADASLLDLSWISTTEGWALAVQPCATGSCAVLAHTTDGGAQWQALPDPPAQVQTGSADCSSIACVSELAFASPTVGYLYGPRLLMTTDGGLNWQPQLGLQVETLTVADGYAYRVAYDSGGCPGPCNPTLQDAAIGSSVWHTLIAQLAYPDRSDSAQIAASGSALLVALYGSQAGPTSAQATVYRSTDGGSTWQTTSDPCSGQGATGTSTEEDLIDLTSAPGGFYAGLCSPHTGSGTFVVTSTDSGGVWTSTGSLPDVQVLALLAAASPNVLAVSTGPIGGNGSFTAEVLVSTDAGDHWTATATDTQQLTQAGSPAWLGFESAQVGWWIGDPHSIWTTQDGGLQWTQTPFG